MALASNSSPIVSESLYDQVELSRSRQSLGRDRYYRLRLARIRNLKKPGHSLATRQLLVLRTHHYFGRAHVVKAVISPDHDHMLLVEGCRGWGLGLVLSAFCSHGRCRNFDFSFARQKHFEVIALRLRIRDLVHRLHVLPGLRIHRIFRSLDGREAV